MPDLKKNRESKKAFEILPDTFSKSDEEKPWNYEKGVYDHENRTDHY